METDSIFTPAAMTVTVVAMKAESKLHPMIIAPQASEESSPEFGKEG